jgi:hypothetical protein
MPIYHIDVSGFFWDYGQAGATIPYDTQKDCLSDI